jgi:transcriptional regulator with XRE-family HTH domain
MDQVTTDEGRQRLGRTIRAARTDANLTANEAASHAGMSPTTWGRIERGDDISVRPATYAAIERVLGWEMGSIGLVLEGGAPVRAAGGPSRRSTASVPVDHIAIWEEEIINEIWTQHPELNDDQREELTARARAKAAELRVIEDRLRRTA